LSNVVRSLLTSTSTSDAAMALAQSEAQADLKRSHETFIELGARPAAALVARRLRERGARGAARGRKLGVRSRHDVAKLAAQSRALAEP
jgi:hypothetical protein